MVKNRKSKSEENVPAEDTAVDSSGEENKEVPVEENGEDITENGDTAVEKKKKPATKKTKAVKKPAVEPERKSSRAPKPVLKEEDQNKVEKSQPKKGQKRHASKSPARAKKAKPAKEEKDYEVEEVVGLRIKKGKKEYKIRWKGYKASQDTWEPEKHLSCQDLIEKYLEEHGSEVTETPKTPAKKAKTSTKSAKKRKTK